MQTAVEGAARAMTSVAAPTREMEQSLKRAQSGVVAASRAFENQKNIAISHKRALEGMGINISEAAQHQIRLRTAVEQTSRALKQQEAVHERSAQRSAQRSSNRQMIAGGLATVGAYGAAHELKAGASATLHTYREFDKERRYAKAVMGLSDDEQEPMVNQAIHMGATTRYNDIQVLEAQRILAGRGLGSGQVMGVVGPAANLGQSLDLSLPEAVKQLDASLFGFKRDVSTQAAATASAVLTSDMQVKAAKIASRGILKLARRTEPLPGATVRRAFFCARI